MNEVVCLAEVWAVLAGDGRGREAV